MGSSSSSESESEQGEYAIESSRASVATPYRRQDADPFETPEKLTGETTKKNAEKATKPSRRKVLGKPTHVEIPDGLVTTGDLKEKVGTLESKKLGGENNDKGTPVSSKERPGKADPTQHSKEKTQTTGKRTRDVEKNDRRISELYEKPPRKSRKMDAPPPTPRRDGKHRANDSDPKKSKKSKRKEAEQKPKKSKSTHVTSKTMHKQKDRKRERRNAGNRSENPPHRKFRLIFPNRIPMRLLGGRRLSLPGTLGNSPSTGTNLGILTEWILAGRLTSSSNPVITGWQICVGCKSMQGPSLLLV